MQRAIVVFHTDEEDHWVAELSCGHGQHTRHRPPLTERAWVQSPEGRAAWIGRELDCLRCDRLEIPETWQPYRRTREFSEASVPAALLADHTTAKGVWARIHVVRGKLRYAIQAPLEREEVLVPGTVGIVPPELPHHVEPLGEAAFYVEFWRAPKR